MVVLERSNAMAKDAMPTGRFAKGLSKLDERASSLCQGLKPRQPDADPVASLPHCAYMQAPMLAYCQGGRCLVLRASTALPHASSPPPPTCALQVKVVSDSAAIGPGTLFLRTSAAAAG